MRAREAARVGLVEDVDHDALLTDWVGGNVAQELRPHIHPQACGRP